MSIPADRCPGVLRPHLAADGALVRLRVPGGYLDPGVLAGLADASQRFADGDVHLTSRGNLQLRGVALVGDDVDPRLVRAVADLGLLPSATHERVRNIVASPFSDLYVVARRLDVLLREEASLASLPGRFLFGLDDGSGDVASLRCDLCAVVDGAAATIRIGALTGPTVPLDEVPDALVDLAVVFHRVRDGVWNVRELPRGGAELGGRDRAAIITPPPVRYGVLDNGVSVLAPLGVLTADMCAGVGDRPVTVTPWRGLVVHDDRPEVLGTLCDTGFVTDGAWTRLTACAGAPRCSRAAGDTRARAHELAAQGVTARTHVVGCDRCCGAPATEHTLVQLRSAS